MDRPIPNVAAQQPRQIWVTRGHGIDFAVAPTAILARLLQQNLAQAVLSNRNKATRSGGPLISSRLAQPAISVVTAALAHTGARRSDG